MKLRILVLLLILSHATFARTTTRVAKTVGTFGIVDIRANNFTPGKPTIIFLHGIGERGSGSITDLGKIANWGGVQYLFQATDVFDFNVVCVQTSSNFQFGEIQYAIQYAIDVQEADSNKIYTINNSLGGYGFAQQAGVDATLPGKFAAIVQVVMGPGEIANTSQNIANSGTPIWFFSSADDLTSGTTVYKTDTLYNRVIAEGGNAWYTRWITGGHTVLTRVIGSYYQAPNNWKLAVCTTGSAISATIFCDPPVSIYTWLLANERGAPVDPTLMDIEPAPEPESPCNCCS